jgi:hypothetical protein
MNYCAFGPSAQVVGQILFAWPSYLCEECDLNFPPMSASQFQALSAIAFQLAATLETYEQDVAAMLRTPADADLYRRVSGHVDQMRMYAAALPPLSVAWVEVLIRHFELTHGLWRVHREPGSVPLAELHEALRDAIRRLSKRCVQLMPAA